MTARRILIADDEPLYLRTTGQLLKNAGYECVCVPDGEQALEKLRTESFDLILSDLNMPGNLKLELLQQGRSGWPD
ncbi:response regulator, partial [bacterium]|nr:response regulator [bacterium]